MPLRRRRSCPVLVVGALIALASPAGPAGQEPPPTFKSGVEVVRIDVSVVDRAGRPVNDLAPGDFTVTVDGKPRAIVSAQFLKYEVREAPAPSAPAPPAAPAAMTQPPPPPRLVLVVVDEDSIEPVEGLAVKQAVAKFLDRLAPNDRVGVATIPRLRDSITLSTRRADTLKALDAVVTGTDRVRYDYNVGLAEAFDIERGYADVAQRVIARECAGQSPTCPEEVRTQVRQVALQAHLRGQRSLDALAGVAEGLSRVEGPKTVLLVSGGMPMPDAHSLAAFDKVESAFAAGQVSLYTLYMERSSFGQARDKPSPTQSDDDLLERQGIENATSVAGGTLMLGVGTIDQYFDRVVTELSGSYLLGVEVAPADRDGRTHQVEVRVGRRGLDVRARKRYVIDEARAARVEPTPAKAGPNKTAGSAATAPLMAEVMTPDVEALVARAGAYAAAYETELSGLVAEENYVQRSLRYENVSVISASPSRRGAPVTSTAQEGEWVPDGTRTLRSDFLLVKAQGGDRWMPFRDVFEVDGKAVREREQRLQKLFLDAPAAAGERAAAINAESARYNIGFVERNTNLPTLALRLLDPARRSRVLFRKAGETRIAGVRTWELAFVERGSPTIVRDGANDLPASGSLWIDPATGRVVRSTMRLTIGPVTTDLTTTYRPDAKGGGTWVPAEMREVYVGARHRLECTATYSNVRRFEVSTSEIQK